MDASVFDNVKYQKKKKKKKKKMYNLINHYVKIVQMRSFFWSIFSLISTEVYSFHAVNYVIFINKRK